MTCEMPNNYLSPETREGVFLDEKKKKLFKVSIEILEEITKICEKHHLRYYAAYGTLLGAVRHKGFIPWDDDMDLWMPRCDLILFKQIAQKELPPHYFLQCTETERMFTKDFIKIRDNRTTATVKSEIDARKRINMGIWVSIFPLDGCPENDYSAEPTIALKYFIRFLFERSCGRLCGSFKSILFNLIAKMIVRVVGIKRLCARRDWYCMQFSNSKRMTSLWSLRGYNEFNCASSVFDEWIDFPFEYTTIRIPKNYEMVLHSLYGDWHVPVKDGADHAYADLEPDIPWRDYIRGKYGWKI